MCLTCILHLEFDCSVVYQNEELFDRKGKYFNVERVGQVSSFVLCHFECY